MKIKNKVLLASAFALALFTSAFAQATGTSTAASAPLSSAAIASDGPAPQKMKQVPADAVIGPPGSTVTPAPAPGELGLSQSAVPGGLQTAIVYFGKINPALGTDLLWIVCLIGSLVPFGKAANYFIYEVIHTDPSPRDVAFLTKVQNSKVLSFIDRVLDVCAGFSLTHPTLDWAPVTASKQGQLALAT